MAIAACWEPTIPYTLARHYEEVLPIKKRVMGADHPSTLSSMNGLAVVYRYQGKYADAERLTKQVIGGRRRALGAEHHDTLLAMYYRGALYVAQGRYDEAEPLLIDGLATSRRVLPNHPDTQNFVSALAEMSWKRGDTVRAESLFRDALTARTRILSATHPTVATLLVTFGEMKLEQKQYAEAESLLLDASAIYDKAASTEWRRSYAQAMRGAALAGLGKRAEAAPLVTSAYNTLVKKRDVIPAERQSLLPKVEAWNAGLSLH
jgi:tetratricopeptide (TPR) repeat protein